MGGGEATGIPSLPIALAIFGSRNWWNTGWRSWWGSGCMDWHWGYEDLNDHDELRRDPLLAVLVDKDDARGEERRRAEDQGMALAGKSTLHRMELDAKQKGERERYKKIISTTRPSIGSWSAFFCKPTGPPRPRSFWMDSTDIPLHGEQEDRFFHGYYGQYCYLLLYIFCGEFVLCARLRPSNIDGAQGSWRN